MLNLRALRTQSGLTMKELGAKIGVAESTISQYETGKRQPDYEILLRLGEFFGVSVDFILSGKKVNDDYSKKFRQRLADELIMIDPPGTDEGDYAYHQLEALSERATPLSLAEACEAADKLGRSMSYMLQEIDEDIDCSSAESKKSPGPEKSEPRDDVERDIIARVKKMNSGLQNLLLSILKIADEQNLQKILSAQVLSDEKSQ